MSQIFTNDDPVMRRPEVLRGKYRILATLRTEGERRGLRSDQVLGSARRRVTVTDIIATAQKMNVSITELFGRPGADA